MADRKEYKGLDGLELNSSKVESLPRIHKTLGSPPSTRKKRKKKRQRRKRKTLVASSSQSFQSSGIFEGHFG